MSGNIQKKSKLKRLLSTLLTGGLAIAVFLIGHGSADADFDNVRIQLLNGSSIRCSIDSIDEDGRVVGPRVPADLKLDQIVSLRGNLPPGTKPKEYHQLQMVGGGTLWVKNLAVKDDLATFQSLVGLEKLKLELVADAIWKETDRVRDVIKNPSPDNDRIIVETDRGERVVEGLLEEIDATHVVLNFKGKSRRISLTIVNAVVTADLGLRTPKGPAVDIQLKDGANIKGRIVKLADRVVTLELPGQNLLEVNTSVIASLNIRSEKLVYLSDLQPLSVQQKSLFVVERPWQRDRSIKGALLTLGFSATKMNTATFQKGIGTQSYSELVFANENQFDRFRAVVGIDAETNGRGDCVFAVVGDGVRLWSQRIRATDDPVSVSVDISGMSRIALVVEPGEQLDLGDHADWGMARFTKSE